MLNGIDIYRQLVAAIEDGDLAPGTRLREAELARQYGVSRTPIREGLKRLEAQGLAVHEPNRGMIVPVLDNDQINELYTVRAVLEGTVARLAAQHATEAEIDLLRDLVEADQAHLDDGARLAGTNRVFHHRLTLACHNRYLIGQIEHMRQVKLLLSGSTFGDAGRRRAAVNEHRAIIDAITARDFRAAEAAGRQHIEAAHRARLDAIVVPAVPPAAIT